MNKSEKALLIISELSDAKKIVSKPLKEVYELIEQIGIKKGIYYMKDDYGNIKTLTGSQATYTKFINVLKDLSKNYKVIDVIVHLHGDPMNLYFSDGIKKSSDISIGITNLNIGEKLRFLYSTACYGAKHADDFVNAGFKCASGANCINMNPGTEYQRFLIYWTVGYPFANALNEASDPIINKVVDTAGKIGFSGCVDSNKIIRGTNKYVNKNSI
ncbi:MAG: hypothetical protein JSS91_05885 [Bacteroidetes bacterium]|nr:hypothetical protein [Bacteroidota bacterium]